MTPERIAELRERAEAWDKVLPIPGQKSEILECLDEIDDLINDLCSANAEIERLRKALESIADAENHPGVIRFFCTEARNVLAKIGAK